MAKMGSVHEPDAQLLSADDAIEDAARLREVVRRRMAGRAVPVRVPLWALLEALDSLEPNELRQVAERAEERLATAGRA